MLGIGKVPLPNGGTAGAAGAAGELGTATGTVVKVGAWLLTSGVLTTALSFAGTLTGVGVAVYTSTVSLNGPKQETFGGTYHSDDLLLDNSDSGCRSAGAEAIARLAVSAVSRLAGSRLAASRLAALRQTVARQTVGSVGGDRVDGDVFSSSRSGGDRRGRLFLLLLVCGRRRCLERVSLLNTKMERCI